MRFVFLLSTANRLIYVDLFRGGRKPLSHGATTVPYPLYTNSLPSEAEFSPFLRNDPRDGFHFPARPVAFFFLAWAYMSGLFTRLLPDV